MRGRVERIGVKPRTAGERGLPKPAVPEAAITGAGVDGDFNRHRMERRAGDPCTNLGLLPDVGPERVAELVRTTLGRRGSYARVLEPGQVRAGDPIERDAG